MKDSKKNQKIKSFLKELNIVVGYLRRLMVEHFDSTSTTHPRANTHFMNLKEELQRLQKGAPIKLPEYQFPFDNLYTAQKDIAKEKLKKQDVIITFEQFYGIIQRLLRSYKVRTDDEFAKLKLAEVKKFLENRRIKQTQEPRTTTKIGKRFIERDENGRYFVGGKPQTIDQNTLYYNVFDILYQFSDKEGFLSYGDIEEKLVSRGYSSAKGNKKRNKRIVNAMSDRQGIFRFVLENKSPNGLLVEIQKGRGLKLNNT